jgi:hypothetical protein
MSQRAIISRVNKVRIGPISIITLIAVLCMAVLGILTISTANATYTISNRQADATAYMYRNETAAQQFVAELDDSLARVRRAGGTQEEAELAVNLALDDIASDARKAADGEVSVVASLDDNRVTAEFICANTRMLNIAITIRDDATYRIEKWEMAAVQNGVQTTGHLWTGE